MSRPCRPAKSKEEVSITCRDATEDHATLQLEERTSKKCFSRLAIMTTLLEERRIEHSFPQSYLVIGLLQKNELTNLYKFPPPNRADFVH